VAKSEQVTKIETEADLTPIADDDSDAAKEEIEFDSLDLKVPELADLIKEKRELAFGPESFEGAESVFLSMPEIVGQHSRKLGLTEEQFARAAGNQGLDVGELLDKVGRQGQDSEEVLSNLESGGMVSLKPIDQRKEAMKSIRRSRNVLLRGEEVKDVARRRLKSGEKQYAFTLPELQSAKKRTPTDFQKITSPTKRQAAVAQVVYDMGSSAGLSRDQMAAILANGLAESRLDPMAKNKANEDSHGVWQFNRSGSGEGANFTVEQLQDPQFQMEKIITATKERDELAGFRESTADANELTKQFMIHFEKPRDQEDSDIKKRQAYLGQANRLLDQASKSSPIAESLAEIDRRKRQEALDIINRGQSQPYKLLLDKEAIGGAVENEIAQPGSAAYETYVQQVRNLTDPEVSSQPERAKIIAQVLADLEQTDIKSAFEGRAFKRVFSAGFDYDVGNVAKKMGVSKGAFLAAAQKEGTKENELRKEIIKANMRHVALYLTTNKMGVPALMSYEFMDPDNLMLEDRVTDEDNYLVQLLDAAGKNRVQLVGLDAKSNLPVFRAEDNLDALFTKLNLHLSFSAGGIRRLLDGPEGESIVEAFKKGSVQGIKDTDDFTKLMLSREGASDGGVRAFAYGSLGFLFDVLTPDPTFGMAKIASQARKGANKLAPLLNKRFVPEALDDMGVAAENMIETQKRVNRAAESLAAGNVDEANKLLEQAKSTVVLAEAAEKKVRRQLIEVMKEVDRTDHNVAMEISREVPLLTGKNADNVENVLGFSEFGLKRDFVHPATERVISRGEAEHQTIPYPEFFDISAKISRLQKLIGRVKAEDKQALVDAAYAVDVKREVLAPFANKINTQLIQQGFTQAKKKGQFEQVRRSVADVLAFLGSREAAELITTNPSSFESRLVTYFSELPSPKKGSRGFDIKRLTKDISKAHKSAQEISRRSREAVVAADIDKELINVTKSLAAIAESRGAAHALTRKAFSEQTKIKVDPIIQSVVNQYEEIGTRKISSTALSFRDELEKAFPALRGDPALHIARNLDQRLKSIARKTNESVEEVFERRDFKNLIGEFKRRGIGPSSADPSDFQTQAFDLVTDLIWSGGEKT
jgi:hypothetical protein